MAEKDAKTGPGSRSRLKHMRAQKAADCSDKDILTKMSMQKCAELQLQMRDVLQQHAANQERSDASMKQQEEHYAADV